jgi:hypothetical protein
LKGRKASLLIGVIVIVAVCLAVISLALTFTAQNRENIAGSGKSNVIAAPDPIGFALEHLSKYQERNVASLLNDYLPNGAIVWSGESGGLSGTYRGFNAIRTFLSTVLTSSERVNITIVQGPSVKWSDSKSAIVSIGIRVSGTSYIIGRFEGEASVHCELIVTDNGWKISSEKWHYSKFTSESQGATTFPQWSLLKSGTTADSGRDELKEMIYNLSVPFAVLVASFAVAAMYSLYRRTR